jgi:hypothetical protein
MSPRFKPLHVLVAAGLAGLATPALATNQPASDADGRVFGNAVPDTRPDWKAATTAHTPPALPAMPAAHAPAGGAMEHPGYDRAAFEESKADWLAECRRRYGGKGGVTGGVVGGLLGGVAGSAIAGRGNRTVGAIAGGVVGAAAGAAIGSSSDRRRARDYCESYLEDYLARQNHGHHGFGSGQPIYGYAMQPMMVMVPVAMTHVAAPAAPQKDCTETIVTEEWVYVRTPGKRYIPPRRHAVPDKRVRIVPDKRVQTN